MLAKLIVTGENREQALERARRALDEFEVDGLATVIPFHRHIVSNPAFIGDGETFEVSPSGSRPTGTTRSSRSAGPATSRSPTSCRARRLSSRSTADGRGVAARRPVDRRERRPSRRRPPQAEGPHLLEGPQSGGVWRFGDGADAGHRRQGRRRGGQEVSEGELIVVLEAMKMENPVNAHKSGTVTGLAVSAGDAVTQGTLLLEIK